MNGLLKEKEDKILFAKVLDRQEAATHKSSYTDFIDPARCSVFMNILIREKKHKHIFVYGGYEHAERKIIGFLSELELSENMEDREEESKSSFPITPISVIYNQKFSKPPTHRDYLGATIGLGLDRGKIGDIVLGEEGATIYVKSDIANYIVEHLEQVGRTSVTAKIGEILTNIKSTAKERRINVASLRVDTVIGAAFNLSRNKASMFIEREKVFVNWKLVKKDYLVKPEDIITVRGVGRVEIGEQVSITKKDRIVLDVILFST